MKAQKIVFLTLFSIIYSMAGLWAFEWPVEDPMLIEAFGSSGDGQFRTGIEVQSDENGVIPIDAGEVVFVHQSSDYWSDFPSGLGDFIMLQHGEGLRSLYAHLDEGSITIQRNMVDGLKKIAEIGDSGYTTGRSLFLSILDIQEQQLANPLLLLPTLLYTPIQITSDSFWWELYPKLIEEDDRNALLGYYTLRDINGERYYVRSEELPKEDLIEIDRIFNKANYGIPPIIENTALIINNKKYPIEESFTVPAGEVELIADIYDLSEAVSYRRSLAPSEIFVYVNGSAVFSVNYDALKIQNDNFTINEDKSITYDDYYLDTWTIRIGSFTLEEGENRIEISARDFKGKEAKKEITLIAE